MSNEDLFSNSTGGDWTTFHAHKHSLVATMELFNGNMVNCIKILLRAMHWRHQLTYFTVKPATLVSIETSRMLFAPSPS